MRARWILVLCVAATAAIAAGCGSSDGDDGGGGGGDVTCDAFPNQGQPVSSTTSAAAAPALTGGTLVEGTYVLTGNEYYNNDPNSGTLTETIVFDGGTFKNIVDDSGAVTVYAGAYSTSGTTLTLDLQCPMSVSLQAQYTATATTLVFTSPENPNHVMTFVLQ